jgi:hypothetical protein
LGSPIVVVFSGMKALPRLVVLASFLLLGFPVQARLDETVQEIEARYGKVLKGVKAEYPATVAGLYQTNGFLITVGFYQNKSYYEQFQKIYPKKPNLIQPITEDERVILLKANCKRCDWKERNPVTEQREVKSAKKDNDILKQMFPEHIQIIHYAYDRSDGLAVAAYDDHSLTLVIRSLVVEKQQEEAKKKVEDEEKKRQAEKLKGF